MFYLDKKEAILIILQRIELLNTFLRGIRKLFSRYLFTSFISKFFLNPKTLGKLYFNDVKNEYECIKNYIDPENKNILRVFLKRLS